MGETTAAIGLRACSWQAGQFRTGAPFTRPFPPVQNTILNTFHTSAIRMIRAKSTVLTVITEICS